MSQCKSILIVEDDDIIRETLRTTLEIEGYRIQTASNGQAGIEILSKMERPCLILLDLMMPFMNGWEFVEELGQDIVLATIPVVIVTAFADRAKGIRVKGVIKKPIDVDILYQTVRDFCGPGSNAT